MRFKNIDTADHVSLASALKAWQQRLGYISVMASLPAITGLTAINTPASGPDDASRWSDERAGKRFAPDLLQTRNRLLSYQKGGDDIVAPLTGGDNCPGNQIPAGAYTAAAPLIDSGDTTNANNTVNRAYWIHYGYYWWDVPGVDHVYRFTLTARGPNSRIEVSRTSGSYEPTIYILDGRFGGCPAGTSQPAYNELMISGPTSGTAVIDQNALDYVPLNIPLYLFVDSQFTDARGSGAYTLRMQDVTVAPTVGVQRAKFDFDGDTQADLSVFRPGNATWYVDRSSQGATQVSFGLSTDKVTPADYDGDGRTDIGIFRDGVWWWMRSSDATMDGTQFGTLGDTPVPADMNADGHAELVIFRNGQWFVLNTITGAVSVTNFGLPGDRPVVADYDNDGRADLAVYRNGEWHLNRSLRGYLMVRWGVASDIPVVGDYDGDGMADLAVYRNGEWWVDLSLYGYGYGWKWYDWGLPTDIPASADYSKDGVTDIAVFRDGTWYLRISYSGASYYYRFGTNGDRPLASAYLP